MRPACDVQIGSPMPQEAKVLPPIFLLYGFAVECLLKGLWVSQGNRMVVGEKFVGITGIRGHELHKMAKKVNFTTSAEEEAILQGLHAKIVSSARYPIGVNWGIARATRYPNGGFGSRTTFHSGDIEVIEKMIGRLVAALGFDA